MRGAASARARGGSRGRVRGRGRVGGRVTWVFIGRSGARLRPLGHVGITWRPLMAARSRGGHVAPSDGRS
eukprot:1240525-Prymnesium_polylepis.1